MAADLEGRVEALEDWQSEAKQQMAEFAKGIADLRSEVRVIDAKLGAVATKSDVTEAVNGILGRALDAVPREQALTMQNNSVQLQRRSVAWQVIGIAVLIAGTALTVLNFLLPHAASAGHG